MAKSTPELKERAEKLIQEAMDVYNPDDISESMKLLMEGWELLEEPQHEWSQSYDLSKYIQPGISFPLHLNSRLQRDLMSDCP